MELTEERNSSENARNFNFGPASLRAKFHAIKLVAGSFLRV